MIFDKLVDKTTADYIVFDLETSGLNINTCEILEIGAIKIRGDKIVDSFESLVKPKFHVDASALAVNHISLKELAMAPSADNVLPRFFRFIGNSKLIGYNILQFDMHILNRYAMKYGYRLDNEKEDVLRIVPHKINGLPNHKLVTVAAYFQIDTSGAHNALRDSEITQECYIKLKSLPNIETASNNISRKKVYRTKNSEQTILLNELKAMLLGILSDNIIDDIEVRKLNVWLDDHTNLLGEYPYDRIYTIVKNTLNDGIIDFAERTELNAIFKEISNQDICDHCGAINISSNVFVLTGDFTYGTKDQVKNYIEHNGGRCKSDVSSKVNYVVVGNLGSPDWCFGSYGTKIKKAKELQAKGNTIKIISENDLLGTGSYEMT